MVMREILKPGNPKLYQGLEVVLKDECRTLGQVMKDLYDGNLRLIYQRLLLSEISTLKEN
jgi:hypothetical protein